MRPKNENETQRIHRSGPLVQEGTALHRALKCVAEAVANKILRDEANCELAGDSANRSEIGAVACSMRRKPPN